MVSLNYIIQLLNIIEFHYSAIKTERKHAVVLIFTSFVLLQLKIHQRLAAAPMRNAQ